MRENEKWIKMKSFVLTIHHSQSLCDWTNWLPVKIYSCRQYLCWTLHLPRCHWHWSVSAGQILIWTRKVEKNPQWTTRLLCWCVTGKTEECKGCVLCTIPDQNTDIFMYTLLWLVTTEYKILQVYIGYDLSWPAQTDNTLGWPWSRIIKIDIPNQ